MVKTVFLRAGYNYDGDLVSKETGLVCPEETLTTQAEKDECDINTIVARFGLTGELPGDLAMPVSGDFTGFPNFHTAMNKVIEAQEEFMRIPADIRARFNNDPQMFMDFLGDEKNRDEAKKLGLLKEDPVVAPPLAVRVVADPPDKT